MSNSTTESDANKKFTFGTRVGMLLIVEASAMSALAVISVLLYIAYSAVTIQRHAARRWSTDTHIHYYFLNLMICDLILSIGGLLNIKWVAEAGVYSGALCTVQGLFKQVGNVGVTLSTMAIALHILRVLVLDWKAPPKFALLVLAGIWVAIALLVAVPNALRHNIYGPEGDWCWITGSAMEQIGLEYFWLWLAAALNIISYMFLTLVIKRVIVVDGGRPRWASRQRGPSPIESVPLNISGLQGKERVRASQMLFYPLVYIIVVLPISAARFSKFQGHDVPFAVTAFADTVFASSGLFNTLLYALTRPRLMPRRPSRDAQSELLARATSSRMMTDRWSRDYRSPKGDEGGFLDLGRSGAYEMPEFLPFPRSARL